MRKISYPIVMFSIVSLIILCFIINDLLMKNYTLFLVKRIITLILCFSVILFWSGYLKTGIILYNISLVFLIIIVLLSVPGIKNFVTLAIYAILDFYQIKIMLDTQKRK